MRVRLGGELLWMLSMVLSGVVGIPLTLMGHTGWGFGGSLVGGGGCFLAVLDLIRVTSLISDSGMMFGVENRLLRKLFQAFIA
jgi:hypothetical protein